MALVVSGAVVFAARVVLAVGFFAGVAFVGVAFAGVAFAGVAFAGVAFVGVAFVEVAFVVFAGVAFATVAFAGVVFAGVVFAGVAFAEITFVAFAGVAFVAVSLVDCFKDFATLLVILGSNVALLLPLTDSAAAGLDRVAVVLAVDARFVRVVETERDLVVAGVDVLEDLAIRGPEVAARVVRAEVVVCRDDPLVVAIPLDDAAAALVLVALVLVALVLVAFLGTRARRV